MQDTQTILYIGRFGLPNDAPSIRVYNNAKLFRLLGYKTVCICLSNCDQEYISYADNISYHFIRPCDGQKRSDVLKNVIELLLARQSYKLILSLIKRYHPSYIILYNDLFLLSWKLNRFCRKENIGLISDVTEWYEYKENKSQIGDFIIPFLTDKRIRYIDPKIGNIIAISPFLTQFYASRKCNVLFLPPLFDVPESIPIKRYNYGTSHTINFIYAGSMGSKDILKPFLHAIRIINHEMKKIRFDIIGMTESDVNKLLPNENLANVNIYAHGRIPHDKVMDYLSRADFGILLRHSLRYAKAGFSTKFAECMSAGLAMLCNRVGGAEEMITNGYDGYVIESANMHDIMQSLNEILNMSEDDILQMRRRAFCLSRRFFLINNYIDKTKEFISKINYE